MKAIFAIVLVLGVAFALEDAQYRFLFEEFRAQNGKLYADAHEALMRYDIFRHNVDKINEMNKKINYQLGITQFADMTESEFDAFVNQGKLEEPEAKHVEYVPLPNRPDEVDWIKKGAVQKVKNQAQCGSCWAFSAVAAMEGVVQIKTGKLLDMSEQQMVDCVKKSSGCRGGWMDHAFEWVAQNGICSQEEYPYTARDGQCKTCTTIAKIKGFAEVDRDNGDALQDSVVLQPVSVAVAASGPAFQFYRGGVIDSNCGTAMNHGITATGYGTDAGKKYYNVKNSWGANWGEKGYVRILREDGRGAGMCVIAHHASYPTY